MKFKINAFSYLILKKQYKILIVINEIIITCYKYVYMSCRKTTIKSCYKIIRKS